MEAALVARVSLDQPLRRIEVPERYQRVLLVVLDGGGVAGHVWLPALRVIPVDVIAAAIANELGERLWDRRFRRSLDAAARGAAQPPRPVPSVSVVVCTRDRPEDLSRCLESLLALRTRPQEIVVVDSAPADDRTERLCADMPVRYVREPAGGAGRARNCGAAQCTGELVAFTDDDCVVDPRWLDELGESFADPLVGAVTGYVGPLELETRAQYLFEASGGFDRGFARRVFDSACSPARCAGVAGASANMVFRRATFAEIGGFAEDLGPGTAALCGEDTYAMYRTLAAGWRVVFEPSRIVWHRHRRDEAALRRLRRVYAAGAAATLARMLLRDREPAALAVWVWWLGHILRQARAVVAGEDDRASVRLLLADLRGLAGGPLRLVLSRWRRRRLQPIRIAPESARSPRLIAVGAGDLPLSVAIASRNREDKLRETLLGLARQSYGAHRFEVTVTLDGSTDRSAEMIATLDVPYPLRAVEQPHLGIAAARNRGAREAAHPVLVFLDDDIVPDPDFLAAHADAHAAAGVERVALGYSMPVLAQDTLWARAQHEWWLDHFRRKEHPSHRWTPVDFTEGNCSMPAVLCAQTGGWDERFTRRRGDWEYGVRLLRRGVLVRHLPDAVGLHHFETSLQLGMRNRREEAKADVLLATKHPEMKSQLPLARFLSEAREFGRPPVARARLALWEALRLRGHWRTVLDGLLVAEYAAGLREAFPSHERLLSFLSSAWDHEPDRVRLDLKRPEPPATAYGGGRAEVALTWGDALVGRFAPTTPGDQWDWTEVVEQAAALLSTPTREAFLLGELGEAARADEPARPLEEAVHGH